MSGYVVMLRNRLWRGPGIRKRFPFPSEKIDIICSLVAKVFVIGVKQSNSLILLCMHTFSNLARIYTMYDK